MDYLANAGQTYLPIPDNTHIDTVPYTLLDPPQPPLPELELNEAAIAKGLVLNAQHQHFLPGVTSDMLDWWWANMEKGYYLWAPGSHKRFSWVREPWKYGFVNSAHMIAEAVGKNLPVFGGSGVVIERLDLSWFPFTSHLEHVICEGIFNDRREFVDSTIHMWQDCPDGCVHIDAAVSNPDLTEPPAFLLEMLAADPDYKPIPPSATGHGEYEVSRWPVFLPTLYGLWKDHPDPSQSVPCDLRVAEKNGKLYYLNENGPIVF